jgi:hypothetical protein
VFDVIEEHSDYFGGIVQHRKPRPGTVSRIA